MNSYGDSVVWLVAPLVDGYGGQRVYDWPAATRTTMASAVQPLSSKETDAGRQVSRTDKTMFCAPVAMLATHRIEWHGEVWRVNGEPETHYLQGRPDHIEAHLVQITEEGT